MNDRSHPRERISAWLDGEIGEPEKVEVERHLESCAECRELVANLRALSADAASEPVPPVPEDLPSRIRRRIGNIEAAQPGRSWFFRALPWSTAASLAAAAVLLAIFLPAEWEKWRAPAPVERVLPASEEDVGKGAPPPGEREVLSKVAAASAPPAPTKKTAVEKKTTPVPPVSITEVREDRMKPSEPSPATTAVRGALSEVPATDEAPAASGETVRVERERRAEKEAPPAAGRRDFAQIVGGVAQEAPRREERLTTGAPLAPAFGVPGNGAALRPVSREAKVPCEAPWRAPVTAPIPWPPEGARAAAPDLETLVRRAGGVLLPAGEKTGALRAWIPAAAWPDFRKALRDAGAAGLDDLPGPASGADCVALDFASAEPPSR